MTAEEYKYYCTCAPRVDLMFTALYQAAWTGKYKNASEKQTLLSCYVRKIKQMGGLVEARKIMKFLDSGLNTKHVKFPPSPSEFLNLKREIPKELPAKPSKRITKKIKPTLVGSIYSGMTILAAGGCIKESHKDIVDLIAYNFERYKKHRKKYGDPIPGAKGYNFYQVDLTGGK